MLGCMAEAPKVDLYNNAYGNYSDEVYRQVRLATYGEDYGQTSWVTTEESAEIPKLLGLDNTSSVLEIGSGSGRYALQLAESIGCRILGADINASGIATANQLAASRQLDQLVKFQQCDASQSLRCDSETFDAVFSNDAFCHISGRAALLGEIHRVLKPGGRLLFSDALIIDGPISNDELATRSSIGYYLYSPLGENERLLERQGFRLLKATDTTAHAASIAKRWHDARETKKDALLSIEGSDNFTGLQRFLACVQMLTSEHRLRRLLYLAQRD
jgi:ubiquinone/menaquinone biosynthesis C-methylase UbiE